MCGIVGIFDTQSRREIDQALLERMNDAQFHRGPVEGGIHREPGLGLGHRRLSIIDLASGHQPLFNEDGSVVVVFNGEIYNFQALAEELRARGHVFRTHCDTEVLVHGWEEWGEQLVHRLRGMFAFAIWDRRTRTLFLARDRLGIKPLFYTLLPDGLFLFGSELKALLCAPQLARSIDPHAVEEYFAYGYIPEPRTIFINTHKLEPGHTLTLVHGAPLPAPRRFWDVSFAHPLALSEDDAREALLEQLRDAVRSHMIADVPLGGFLSGGVDSSAVVAMMAHASSQPVNTCSIAFDDPAYDESRYAEEVARRYHTDHFSQTVSKDDFALIDRLARLYDEPYADSSAIPTYQVCALARQRVTVALSGDGGDENFAGYRRYRYAMAEENVRSLLPQSVRRPLFGTLGRLYPKADWAPRFLRAKTTFQALARDLVEGYFHGVSLMDDAARQRLFRPEFRQQLHGYSAIEVMRAHARASDAHDPLSLIQYLDLKTYLVGDILTKVDRASMAHALEVRVPLLDHRFVEWAASLPPDLKLRGQEGKYLLKKALEPHLPHDVLYRKKMGFAVPLAAWFRGPLRERVREAVLGRRLADTGYFDPVCLRTLVEHHQSGRRDYSAPLWSLLMFDAFLRNVLDQPPA